MPSPSSDTNETVQDVLRDMRQWKGDYSVFADRIEQSLSAGASGGGECVGIVRIGKEPWNAGLPVVDLEALLPIGTRLFAAPASPATGDSLPPFPDAAYMTQLGNEAWNREQVLEYGRQCLATPQPESEGGEWVMVPRELVKFLNGDAPLDGHWYGDRTYPVVDGVHSPYWWRKYLNAAAAQPQQAPAQELEESRGPGNQAHCPKCDYFYPKDGVCMCYAGRSDATPPAHGDGEGVRSLIERKLRKLPKHWRSHIGPGAATREIKRADGDTDYCNDNRIWAETAIAIENFLYDYDELTARPAPEADARDGVARVRKLFEGCASMLVPAEYADGYREALDHVDEAIAAMSLPAQGREGE